jgi:hypothetical protein
MTWILSSTLCIALLTAILGVVFPDRLYPFLSSFLDVDTSWK